jgi:hypothetical protein
VPLPAHPLSFTPAALSGRSVVVHWMGLNYGGYCPVIVICLCWVGRNSIFI